MTSNHPSTRRKPKHTRNWRTTFSATDALYESSKNGWNIHKLRREPTVDDLIARRDEVGEDF